MRKLFYLLVIPILMIAASCGKKEMQLNVMTFNIRLDAASDSLNNWQYRKDVAAEMIRMYDADIVGTQEVLPNQRIDLKDRLPEYNVLGVGRDNGDDGGEYSALFYKKDRFEEIESGTFWLSETPETASMGWDAAYKRVATWTILKDKATDRQFFAMNTHLDHIGSVARHEGSILLLKQAETLSKGLPIILTGDFNAAPGDNPIKTLTDTAKDFHVIDSKTIAEKTSGTEWTFHDFGRLAEDQRERIDYIFVSKGITVSEYEALPDTLNGKYTSDHKAVLAKIIIK